MDIIWHTGFPEKDGNYICTAFAHIPPKDIRFLKILSFAQSLKSADNYDFTMLEEDHPGWYDYDGEWGYYEYRNVLAWAELPEPYQGEA